MLNLFKVVFPIPGDYLLELYAHSGRQEHDEPYEHVCTYILQCYFILNKSMFIFLNFKVVFPVPGDYKLELYAHSGRQEHDLPYKHVCIYIFQCIYFSNL